MARATHSWRAWQDAQMSERPILDPCFSQQGTLTRLLTLKKPGFLLLFLLALIHQVIHYFCKIISEPVIQLWNISVKLSQDHFTFMYVGTMGHIEMIKNLSQLLDKAQILTYFCLAFYSTYVHLSFEPI